MTRIFIGLASLNAIGLLASAAIGFLSEGRAGLRPDTPLTAGQQYFTLHLFVGISSAVLTMMVHSLVLTYFMGTGRWVQEVVAAYRMPDSVWLEAKRLKSRATPLILGGIALVILTASLGAASDRGLVAGTVHLVAAIVTIAFNLWSHVREYDVLRANGALIERIMAEVTRMRRERGL